MRGIKTSCGTVWLSEREWKALCARFDPTKFVYDSLGHTDGIHAVGYPMIRAESCPLCAEYMHAGECRRCPFAVVVGDTGCIDTIMEKVSEDCFREFTLGELAVIAKTPQGMKYIRTIHRGLMRLKRVERRR